MKYNEKYKRWCREDGKIFRQDKDGNFIECKQRKHWTGYLVLTIKRVPISSHRLIWETLKGPIPPKMDIDHINTIRTDNRIENLRCVTHRENCNNINTIKKKIGNKNKLGKGKSDFGLKFIEHFGITRKDNLKLYDRELHWFKNHNNKCRWEN